MRIGKFYCSSFFIFIFFKIPFYLCRRGVFNNDVKPLNLLIDEKSHEIFVADWGLGEFYFWQNQTLSYHVGTRLWKAPELLLGDEHYTYAVDVFAAGVTLAGLLYRQVHFFRSADNQQQILSIAEVIGTEEFYDYIQDYNIVLDKEWKRKHFREVIFNRLKNIFF